MKTCNNSIKLKTSTKFENFRQIELNEKRNQNVQLEILVREDSASELQIHCLLLKVIHPAKIYTVLLLYLLELKSILLSIKHELSTMHSIKYESPRLKPDILHLELNPSCGEEASNAHCQNKHCKKTQHSTPHVSSPSPSVPFRDVLNDCCTIPSHDANPDQDQLVIVVKLHDDPRLKLHGIVITQPRDVPRVDLHAVHTVLWSQSQVLLNVNEVFSLITSADRHRVKVGGIRTSDGDLIHGVTEVHDVHASDVIIHDILDVFTRRPRQQDIVRDLVTDHIDIELNRRRWRICGLSWAKFHGTVTEQYIMRDGRNVDIIFEKLEAVFIQVLRRSVEKIQVLRALCVLVGGLQLTKSDSSFWPVPGQGRLAAAVSGRGLLTRHVSGISLSNVYSSDYYVVQWTGQN